MKRLLFLFGLLPLVALAQRPAPYWQTNAAVGAGPDIVAGAVDAGRMWPIGKRGRWAVGGGLRFTGTRVAEGAEYTTAPAELTSGETGLQVIFLPTKEENLDTLFLRNSAAFYSLNLMFEVQYILSDKWAASFDIDLVGVSFGPSTQVRHESSRQGAASIEDAKPTSLNALLTSDNDIGSLNSTFAVRYKLTPKLALRAGFGFLFTELTTSRTLQNDNDRFRLKSGLGTLGVTWTPGRE